MRPRRLLRRLQDAGFRVRADGDDLVVRPGENLTPDLRRRIRDGKQELLALVAGSEHRSGTPDCVDCGQFLPLAGVRCPVCRDSEPESCCASCGARIDEPDLSICDLCQVEREVAVLREERRFDPVQAP